MKKGRGPKHGASRKYAGVDALPKCGPHSCHAVPIPLMHLSSLDNSVGVNGGYVADNHTSEELDTIRREGPQASGAASKIATIVDDRGVATKGIIL